MHAVHKLPRQNSPCRALDAPDQYEFESPLRPEPTVDIGFPVIRNKTLLDPVELQTEDLAGSTGKGPHIASRRAEPLNWFVRHDVLYKY